MINLIERIERGYEKLNVDLPNIPRASNAGECALRLWARYHGEEDIPVDLDTKLTRFMLGHEVGKMIATLLDAGSDDCVVELEKEVNYKGISGHIDVLLTFGDGSKHVIEVKSNYFSKGSDEKPFQAMQAAIYATAVGAQTFSVFVLSPALQRVNGVQPKKYKQYDYVTADFASLVEAEVKRMLGATQESPPLPDPDAAWRCSYCQFSGCPRNVNVLNPNRKEKYLE